MRWIIPSYRMILIHAAMAILQRFHLSYSEDLISSISHERSIESGRKLADFHLPPANGEYTDYSAPFLHTISHSSNLHTYKAAIDTLKSLDPRFKQLENTASLMAPDGVALLHEAIETLYNTNKSIFDVQPNSLVAKLVKNPNWESVGSADVSEDSKQQEGLWYRAFEHRRVQDVFDVILPIECDFIKPHHSLSLADFLSQWRPILEPMHLIVIQGDGCDVDTATNMMPSWVDYDLFIPNDLKVTIPKESAWIFNFTSNIEALANVFGIMVADRDFVYFLDRDTLPGYDSYNEAINKLTFNV